MSLVIPEIRDVINYMGDKNTPRDIIRRRQSVRDLMLHLGTPVVIKHMYTDADAQSNVAIPSINSDPVYTQSRHNDPLSHGVGFHSIETQPGEWVAPDGTLLVSPTAPDDTYVPAPRYRGFGQGYLTYLIEPDAATDYFKLDATGVLIRVREGMGQAPWYPSMSDNDLLIEVEVDRTGKVIDHGDRYQLKMPNPVTMRGHDRRGAVDNLNRQGGNRYTINQLFGMTLVPSNDQLYNVEIDR